MLRGTLEKEMQSQQLGYYATVSNHNVEEYIMFRKFLWLFVFSLSFSNFVFAYEISLDDDDFQPSSSYNKNIGLLGAYVSEKVYSNHFSDVYNYLDSYGFRSITTHSIKLGVKDTQFLVANKSIKLNGNNTNLILLAFRGTAGTEDVLTDIDSTKRTFTDGYTKVHKGFFDAMKLAKSMEYDIGLEDNVNQVSHSLGHAINNANSSNETFLIVGHSLGGAIATLYAADLINRGVPKSKILVYTYGSPAVGDENFVSTYDGHIYYHRIRNKYDPVPFSAYIDTLIDTGNTAENMKITFSNWYTIGLTTVKNLWNATWNSYPYKHIGYMRVFDNSGNDITSNYENLSIFSSGNLIFNVSEHFMSKYISNLEKYAKMQVGLEEKSFSWNGNASVISYNSGNNTGFGLNYDETMAHWDSSANPVVFFQWQRDSSDGKNLKIYADSDYTSATIYYGYWNSSPNEKKTYKNVTLPFVLDPTKDGFSGSDGKWFTIAVSFNKKPINYSPIRATATKDPGTNTNPDLFLNRMNLENKYYWSGNGSLISFASGSKTGYGLTYDIAVVYPDVEFQAKPSVFFQWEIDASDGKNVEISSDYGCFNTAKITTGDWASRDNDLSVNATLPYTIHTNKSDGKWLLIRVDLLTKPLCKDYVRAKIVN